MTNCQNLKIIAKPLKEVSVSNEREEGGSRILTDLIVFCGFDIEG